MTVTVYKSTDSSAPVLTGSVGTLITLLDAILVNGYGSKAAQGWTKPFSGTNQAVYRQPTSGANGRYLNVIDDGATTAGAANYSRVYGMEAATAQNTGTGLFPTTAQIASPGLYVIKSATADGTARPWFCYGNGKIFYLWIATDSSATTPVMGTLFFGDFTSYVPSDTFNTILIANTTTTAATTSTPQNLGGCRSTVYTYQLVGHYVCRNYTGTGSAVNVGKVTNESLMGGQWGVSGAAAIGSQTTVTGNAISIGTALVYPNAADGGLYMERLWVTDVAGNWTFRGELPGMWAPMHLAPLAHLDTFSGTGALSGKTFESLRFTAVSAGNVFMETSNTW